MGFLLINSSFSLSSFQFNLKTKQHITELQNWIPNNVNLPLSKTYHVIPGLPVSVKFHKICEIRDNLLNVY